MQTHAGLATDAERHVRELQAVRAQAAATGAAYARLQEAHHGLRREHQELQTSAAMYRDALAVVHDDHLDHLRIEATPSSRTGDAYRRRG